MMKEEELNKWILEEEIFMISNNCGKLAKKLMEFPSNDLFLLQIIY